ncbi:MAG: hypothetical protein AAGA08_03770 [Pseudomonadota bacterium]
MSIIRICLELAFVWLFSIAFAVATEHNLSIWMAALLAIIVDRSVTSITSFAKRRRTGLRH